MIDRLMIWAMSNKWFWSGRTRLERIKFLFEASAYKQGNSISRSRASASVLLTLILVGLKSMLIVALALGVLLFSEDYLEGNLGFLQPLSEYEKNYNIEQIRLYAQLLTAIFSIYFATIGIILSSGYNNFRNDIIQLLTNEQVGSVYAKVLVFSATFSLTASALPLIGAEPGRFVYLTGTALTLTSSLTLFPLGRRLFSFFNLNLLARSEILPNILTHIKEAANPRHSASLANHHSRAARIALDQLCYLDDRIVNDKRALVDNLPDLTEIYSWILLRYLRQKHKIEQGSYWFPRKWKHQRWFFAGDSATSMALKTSSQLNAEETVDLNWLENKVVERLERHIKLAFANEELGLALELISRFTARVNTYAREFQFDVGMEEVDRMRSLIENSLERRIPSVNDKDEKLLIAIADTWATLGSNLCFEVLRRMMTFEKELEGFFKEDVWSPRSIQSLPAVIQVDIGFIVRYIDFEREIEGYRLSRPKYVQQLTVRKIVQRYEKILPKISEFHANTVLSFIDSLITLGFSKAATQVALTSLHTHWKLPQWYKEVSLLLGRYSSYSHYSEVHYALPEINVESMTEQVVKAREKIVELLGSPKLINHIFEDENDDDLPDHFGQVYFELAEECIHSLERNDNDKFGKIFPTFFSLALLASDSKFADPAWDLNNEFRLHLISTVINDLASVIGFSILYSEYFGNNELSKMAVKSFKVLLDKLDNKQQYLKRMLLLSNPATFSFAAPPRGLIRINWKIAFENMIREDGYGEQLGFDKGKAHNSAIINAFLSSHADASHLFFATQVLPVIDDVDFDIDYQITSLARDIREGHEEPFQ